MGHNSILWSTSGLRKRRSIAGLNVHACSAAQHCMVLHVDFMIIGRQITPPRTGGVSQPGRLTAGRVDHVMRQSSTNDQFFFPSHPSYKPCPALEVNVNTNQHCCSTSKPSQHFTLSMRWAKVDLWRRCLATTKIWTNDRGTYFVPRFSPLRISVPDLRDSTPGQKRVPNKTASGLATIFLGHTC